VKVNFDKHVYRVLLAATLGILTLGTVVYHFLEKLSWVDAYYFSVITLTTVGYGDIVPHTAAGKIFTTFYVLAGVGIITTFVSYSVRRRGAKIANHNKATKNIEK
jgi:voltage-gated potassium channel